MKPSDRITNGFEIAAGAEPEYHLAVNTKPTAALSALLLSLTLILTAAIALAGPAPQKPAGGSGSLVTIHFRATTGEAVPVTDLRSNDVTLKVKGRDREIRSFELIQFRGLPGGVARAPIPPPFATNGSPAGRRDTLFLIDDESIPSGAEPPVRVPVDQYLAGLAAGDRVSAVTVQGNGVNIGLTDQHAALRLAVAGLVGRGSRAESADDSACRTNRVLGALTGLAENFPAGGAPVTVLFFSTGISAPGVATMSNMGRTSGMAASAMCEVGARDFQRFQEAAFSSAVNFYVVDAADSSASAAGASNPLRAGLEHLAGVTGNALIQPIRNGEQDIQRVVRENSALYRVAFESEVGERNGSSVNVEVAVKRAGVEVKARPKVVIPKDGGRPANAKAPAAKDLLRDAKVSRALELRAAAYASREAGTDRIRLVIIFEPVEPSVEMKSAVVGLYDEKGKLTVQGSADITSPTSTPLTVAVLANAGTYRMRVAAVDSAGRAGTVDTQLDVRLAPAAPLQLSSLVLGVAEGGSFAGRLTFTSEPMTVGYLEVYGVGKTSNVSATVELADSEDGPTLAQGTTRVAGDGSTDRRVILAGVPIGQLAAGDHLVRVLVSLDGKPVGRAIRTLHKSDK